MDFAKEIGGILEGTECKNCPWYKHCVSPAPDPLATNISTFEKMSAGIPQGIMPEMEQVLQILQRNIVISCPIFAKRLKENPKLIENIRKIMQEWDES